MAAAINNAALAQIALLMCQKDVDRDALAEQWDKAILVRRIKWLPSWLTAWVEKSDASLNLALADATLVLRAQLIDRGALKLV